MVDNDFENLLSLPSKIRRPANKKDKSKCYLFHKDHGHNTSTCFPLKDHIENVIRRSYLKKYVGSRDHANHNLVISREINKLLRANFIKEVHYPTWLSNIVLVFKKWMENGTSTSISWAWTMPVLKDNFPLPLIDQLVDATIGHEALTFMDT